MNLTLKEKRTVYQILVLIMEADLVNRQEEIDFLDKTFSDFGLTFDEFDHMDDIDIDYLKNEFLTFEDAHRQYASELFYEMAKCDGYVDPREIQMIDSFTTISNI